METKNIPCIPVEVGVKSPTMYAIAFDLDTEILKHEYTSSSYQNAYKDIELILKEHEFSHTQGSVYFGNPEKINVVTCVMAIMDLTTRCSWFAKSVKDIRMLRIEDNNDLMPIVAKVAQPPDPVLRIVPDSKH